MSLPEGPAEEKKKDDELLDTSADDESKEVTAPPYLLLDKGSDDYDMKKAPSEDAAASTNKVMVGSASIREVFSFARTRKTKLFMAGSFAAAIVSGATMPAMAFYFAQAFEELSASTASENFLAGVREVAYAFMALGAIIFISMTTQSALMETAAGEMTRNMKTSWFEALLRQDMAYYDIQDVSGQATLISSNGRKYRKGVGRKFAEAVQFTFAFIGAMVYSFIASWQVTLAILAISPVLVLSGYYVIQIVTSYTARSNACYAKAGAVVSTAVSAIRTILSLNAVEHVVGQYEDATLEAREMGISNAWVAGFANGTNFVSMLLAYIVVTGFGAWLLYDQVINTGCDPSAAVEGAQACDPSGMQIFGALFGVSIAAAVIPQISICLENFTGARSACYPAIVAMSRRLEDDNKEKDVEIARRSSSHHVRRELESLPKYEIDAFSNIGLKPNKVVGLVEFNNVSFSYPARPEAQVLKNFSLKIESGKTVALCGPSGSGKSTVVQLIERFYDPITGSVTLDGVDLKNLNTRWLREQIGLVLQEPKLFGKSIRENICLGSTGVTQEQIEEAAKMANAHNFIMSFPEGYDTQVGDLGSQISGGQKQRIAIARILLKNPKIVLLDEATSALDSESEAAVQQALDRLMRLEGVTTFVIAHRLSTIKNADVIAVVKDGTVLESGTHYELLSMQGGYYDLVEAQKGHSDAASDEEEDQYRRQSSIDPSVYTQSCFPSDETLDPDVVTFRDVRFRYPARYDNEVFRGLNFSVCKGETLALVGPSGSGKSTVVQLMECFYHPTGGSVEYCGIDLKDINVRWLRNELGLVSQEATLFDTTVEENIRYGYPEATIEQIVEAAKQANCHDFISSFPDGYQTLLGEGGSLVSGGQKQRIAIARAILKKPKLLLLDEATSALDSESEKIVQAALDKIMSNRHQSCIVIAHRLSTIRNADRIAVIESGKVREMGSHERLMAIPKGRYRRLQALQNLDGGAEEEDTDQYDLGGHLHAVDEEEQDVKKQEQDSEEEVTKEEAASNSKRAWLLGSEDLPFLLVGAVGALVVGLFFPAWGILFAYMVEVFYVPVAPCPPAPVGFNSCTEYHYTVADYMKDLSLKIVYAYLGLCAASWIGNVILFWGFRSGSERMNKRVRDSAFTNLLRQEVAFFDMRAPGTITTQLADDAAMLHAFAGEPIRTLTVSLASVLVGLVISFVLMWPFALLVMALVPFLAFGAEMEMRTYLGEDEGVEESPDEHSPGGIVVETLSNMRTVASLVLEHKRAEEYDLALQREDPHPLRTNTVKGSFSGLGQFVQYWSFALMFWWGGWLMLNYDFSYKSYLISMFALFFSMYGLTVASEGAVDREKAKAAAHRIFALTDRKSEIDPLSDEGTKKEL